MSEDTIKNKKKEPLVPLENVVYRKYDSDDIIRIRSASILTDSEETAKGKAKVDIGALQKISVCLGVKNAPWFGDRVDETDGVTKEILNRRMGLEFRRIPVDLIDRLFKEAQTYNKADFNPADLKKE